MSAEQLGPEPETCREAEAGILGILIWLPNFALPRLSKVRAEDFQEQRHQVIFEAVRTLHDQRASADLAAVIDWLGARNRLESTGGREYLTKLVDEACYAGAYLFDRHVAKVKSGRGDRKSEVGGQSGGSRAGGQRSEVGGPSVGSDQSIRDQTSVLGCQNPEVRDQTSDVANAGARLLDDLKAFFERYVVLPRKAAEVLALWTVHSYAWRLGSVTTYLGVVSRKKRCGKTKVLMCLHKVVHRPEFASNITPPAVFYAIEETQPTLLIDEADTFLAGKSELRGILNAGYTRESAYVLRVANRGRESRAEGRERVAMTNERTNDEWSADTSGERREPGTSRLARFSCWCPKVIAMIGLLPDTLADRCVMIEMRRKAPGQKCQRLRGFNGSELRNRCARWAEEHRARIETLEPPIPEELNDRAADIWEPLLVIADLAGGAWPQMARAAALELNGVQALPDMTVELIADIEAIFKSSGKDKLFNRDLVEALLRVSHGRWCTVRRGGRITGAWLARHLSSIGIHSRTIRVGLTTGRGFCLEDFSDTCGRSLGKAA